MKDKYINNNFSKICGVAYDMVDIERIIEFCNKHSYFYYYIKHEADGEVNKDHYHFIIESNSEHRFVIKSLLTDTFTINLFEKCLNVNSYLRYMTHIDYDSKKHYSINDIITNSNFIDLSKKINNGNLSSSEINYLNFSKLCELILNGYIVNFKQVLQYCLSNGIKYSTNWSTTLNYLLRSMSHKINND